MPERKAIVDLAEANSRMKDFYDVYKLLETHEIDRANLSNAIIETFRHRQTIFQENHNLFLPFFYQDEKRNIQWKKFLEKNALQHIEFQNVLGVITDVLFPIYKQIK